MASKNFDYKNLLKDLKKQYTANKNIISFVVYVILVFVVVYGLTIGVYDGFPIMVPYVIMLIFLFMALRRLYQWWLKPQVENESEESPKNKN